MCLPRFPVRPRLWGGSTGWCPHQFVPHTGESRGTCPGNPGRGVPCAPRWRADAVRAVREGPFDVQGRDNEAYGVHIHHSVQHKDCFQRRASWYCSPHRGQDGPVYHRGYRLQDGHPDKLRLSGCSTIGLQLSGFVQLPLLYSGCTRFARSGGMSVLPMAMSQRRAVSCLLIAKYKRDLGTPLPIYGFGSSRGLCGKETQEF